MLGGVELNGGVCYWDMQNHLCEEFMLGILARLSTAVIKDLKIGRKGPLGKKI